MARMIPARVPDGTPYSERRIFDFLDRDPATSEWSVLHSVGLRRTRIGPYGEIDFVVIIPGKGIVCLEVKGGEVSCDDGIWKTKNRKTGKTFKLGKSPYLQAREGMFELIGAVKENFGTGHSAAGCPFSYAVVFPDVHAPPATPESESWETLDIGTLTGPISSPLERNIMKAREKLRRNYSRDNVSLETAGQIRQFLRPDFERIINRSTSISRTEEQLISLTEEQYAYLDISAANDRVLVTGAAGTGKTVLALECARREAAAGRSVLLLCFNKLLGKWLQSEIEGAESSLITARTYHSFLRSVIASSSYEVEFSERCKNASQREIYEELYSFYSELAISERGKEFDMLVVDEAQDLVCEENLGVLGGLLRGGIAGGRWAIFGDFTRQAIYGTGKKFEGDEQAIEMLRDKRIVFSIIPLKVNCRNTRQIGEETALLSGFESLPYRLTEINGLAVDYRYWKNREEEIEHLGKAIRRLLSEGVATKDIVILSPNRFEKSAVSELASGAGYSIVDVQDIAGEPEGSIIFSTIHAFKGMESPAVVLCGFSDILSEEQRSLLYVGMSRARSHLVILFGENIKKYVPELVSKRLFEKWQK
jgi:hypothetical protein